MAPDSTLQTLRAFALRMLGVLLVLGFGAGVVMAAPGADARLEDGSSATSPFEIVEEPDPDQVAIVAAVTPSARRRPQPLAMETTAAAPRSRTRSPAVPPPRR